MQKSTIPTTRRGLGKGKVGDTSSTNLKATDAKSTQKHPHQHTHSQPMASHGPLLKSSVFGTCANIFRNETGFIQNRNTLLSSCPCPAIGLEAWADPAGSANSLFRLPASPPHHVTHSLTTGPTIFF